VRTERDVTKRFQNRTAFLPALVDKIIQPSEPFTIALKHLDDDPLSASMKKNLTRREIKFVSKRVLEALKVLHEDEYVHTRNLLSEKRKREI
jgi:hypothetical protein